MPRGNLYTPGEKARRLTIRLQETEWTLFENEADEHYLDWQGQVQWLVNLFTREAKAAAYRRANSGAKGAGITAQEAVVEGIADRLDR